ncbi:hypothetical protein ACFXDJ_15440 [Streptomyces sp. NPDC059443]|uniref:hypothetical protein n=1 Tax=unclassified Streptomyces TaxID=2593676 RepID=UPI0036AFCAE1
MEFAEPGAPFAPVCQPVGFSRSKGSAVHVTSERGLRIHTLKQRWSVQRLRGWIALVLLGATIVVGLVSAVLPHLPLFATCALLGPGLDLYLHIREPRMMRRLGQYRGGVTQRALVRCTLLLVLAARTGLGGHPVFIQLTILIPVFLGTIVGTSAITAVIQRHRRLPVSARNIELGWLRIGDAPPGWLVNGPGRRLIYFELLCSSGILAYTVTGVRTWLALGLGMAVALALAVLLLLVPHLHRALRVAPSGRVLKRVDQWLGRYRPKVILYFSGGRDSIYQVNMWLESVEALNVPALLIMRERGLMQKLAPTRLPVLCVPSAPHLINLNFSSVRVVLYAANVGKNIHMLRLPTPKHVFLGHGDSDKLASVNPYSKVYDQVWVAGRAGRDRYALADVGVRDEDIVEVGRPQLDAMPRMPDPHVREVPTVLYAPTWEGWDCAPGNTSLIEAGENIVRSLLRSNPPVRVLYRPHPFTGLVNPRARKAHERVCRMLEGANRARGDRRERPAGTESAGYLETLDAEISDLLASFREAGADEAQQTRDAAAPRPEALARLRSLQEERDAEYWLSLGDLEHRMVTAVDSGLYACFAQADLMISDISSVVSDFVETLKPYALTDTARLGADEFRRQNTAARAAYILTPDAKGVPDLVAMLYGEHADPLLDHRNELATYLLGSCDSSPTDRFATAVERLVTQGDAEDLVMHEGPPSRSYAL